MPLGESAALNAPWTLTFDRPQVPVAVQPLNGFSKPSEYNVSYAGQVLGIETPGAASWTLPVP